MKRRSFIATTGGVMGGLALGPLPALGLEAIAPEKITDRVEGMPRRVLGRTGEKVSIIGFPGLCLIHEEQEKCNTILRKAFERGVNYFDVAPAYGNGDAEIKMGKGLEGMDRDKIFLACKTKARDQQGALEELDRSLKRLKTDRFDLYQMHHIRTPEEVKRALGPGGAIETFLKAREQGKVRFFGFSAHTTKGALEAMRGFDFETVMFPINFIERFKIGFGKEVLAEAKERKMAIAAIKPMSGGLWPQGVEKTRQWWYRPLEEPDQISQALRYTLSQAGVAAGFPPGFADLADKAVDAVQDFKPIDEAGLVALQKMAEDSNSVFKREEDALAGLLIDEPVYADSPHETCPYRLA